MALDREGQLKEADRLLKQGKVQSGLQILKQVAASAARDLTVQNRIGDILARNRRGEEALLFYRKIAEQYTQAGFYPKAVAILKKVLRIRPEDPDALLRLGELYLGQRLAGEARAYLLRAAEKALEGRDIPMARTVLERLAEADPADPGHRIRLAELLAAEGASERAGEQLLRLGDSLAGNNEARDDRERAYRRAVDLLPDEIAPKLGLARFLADCGNLDEAESTLATVAAKFGDDPRVTCEKAMLCEAKGRSDEADRLITATAAEGLPDGILDRVASHRLGSGGGGSWKRVDPLLAKVRPEDAIAFLERMAADGEGPRIGALERLLALREAEGTPAIVEGLATRLAAAYRAASRDADAVSLEARISGKTRHPAGDSVSGSDSSTIEPSPGGPSPLPEVKRADVPIEAEAPPVPLNKADEEFVNGRLTQMEILEKYGLLDKAIEQAREVTARFPGHVVAQRKRVALLREKGVPRDLGHALVDFALALRAAGEHAEARKVAKSAALSPTADPRRIGVLRSVGLLEQNESARAPRKRPSRGHPSMETSPPETDDVIIDFDDEEQGGERGKTPPELDEARFYAEQGMAAEAHAAIARLRAAGVSGPEIDELEASLPDAGGDPGSLADLNLEDDEDFAGEKEGSSGWSDEESVDDLSALAAALESEVFVGGEGEPVAPEAPGEQSIEEVFAAFREAVQKEVDSDDFRTHYDLGIAYKEMGLVEEAITEFELSSNSEELGRDSCIMLGVCHCEVGRTKEAVSWYRKALEAPGGDGATSDLRYDLAEVLLQDGEAEAALECFRSVAQGDPSFRDVRTRIVELEKRLGS